MRNSLTSILSARNAVERVWKGAANAMIRYKSAPFNAVFAALQSTQADIALQKKILTRVF